MTIETNIRLPNTENDPWIIISDLNELSNLCGKALTSEGSSTIYTK